MRFISVLLAMLALGVAPARGEDANSFIVQNVRVFDGEHVLARTNVLVLDGLISEIGDNVRAPEGVAHIDGQGMTLIPGLIDAHVHVYGSGQADALRFGVTTVLDMFNLSHDFAAWRTQRESLARTASADTWSAGTGASAPGGHPNQYVPEDMPRLVGAENAQAFVDARIAEGSDYIKIIMENGSALDPEHLYPTLTREEVCGIVAAAHARGKNAFVHVTRMEDARIAIACAADGLAHVFSDRVADAAFVRLARDDGVVVVSTLSVIAGVSGSDIATALAARADIAPLLSQGQRGSVRFHLPHAQPAQILNALQNVGLLHAAGVPILAGTDAPGPVTAEGFSMHEELALLVQAGLTPGEALHAATAAPADAFGLTDRGYIRPGRRADLILVRGDPTRDIDQSLAIERIWKNGYVVDRAPPAP